MQRRKHVCAPCLRCRCRFRVAAEDGEQALIALIAPCLGPSVSWGATFSSVYTERDSIRQDKSVNAAWKDKTKRSICFNRVISPCQVRTSAPARSEEFPPSISLGALLVVFPVRSEEVPLHLQPSFSPTRRDHSLRSSSLRISLSRDLQSCQRARWTPLITINLAETRRHVAEPVSPAHTGKSRSNFHGPSLQGYSQGRAQRQPPHAAG